MSDLTLELIASATSSYEQAQSIVLEVTSHVHQRVERFRYLDDIKPVAVALDYAEAPELDSWRTLQVANRTYGIPVNSDKNAEVRKDWATVTATAVSSPYKKVLITNRIGVDQYNERRPLFWRHKLPVDVTECNLEIVTRGNLQKVDSGYEVDLDNGNIYTNFQNFFDPGTGAYTLFYVTCTDINGGTFHQLLHPEPVANEADWMDIDLDTGKLTTDYPVYSFERNSSGYTFYMNEGDTWHSRPLESSLIQPRLPAGRDPEDPWYLRFSAGDLSALVNERVRRYYLPEFDQQNYSPSKPYIYSPYERVLWVNERVVTSTRRNLAIDPENGLHFTLFVSDFENNLLRVLTTDASLEGKRYSNTNVFYESDQIRSWDNTGGFVSLAAKLHPGYELAARFHYEADDYEYQFVNLNPLNNSDLVGRMVVFYMIPDVDPDDRAIHHLVVDRGGFIIECSQDQGFAYPNLQLFESDGVTYNPGTVIGLRYISDIETDTFLNRYAAGYENDFGYGVLAEVSILDVLNFTGWDSATAELAYSKQGGDWGNVDDPTSPDYTGTFLYDVRRLGGVLRDSRMEQAFKANARLLQSVVGYGEDGQEVPKQKVMIVKAPLSLRDDYGGNIPKAEAERLMVKHLDSSALAVVEWDYPAPDVTAWSTISGQVDLSWTWEGPDLTYKLYRRENPVSTWVEVYSVAGAATPAAMSYIDTDVTIGDVMYYTVRVQETIGSENVLYPKTHSVAVKVI